MKRTSRTRSWRFEATVLNGTATEGRFPECGIVGSQSLSGRIDWLASAVLVHPKMAVTAAHVLRGAPNVIAFGVTDVVTQRPAPDRLFFTRPADAMVPRDEFRIPGARNDILLLKLDRDVGGIDPAELPEVGSDVSAGDPLHIVGFGHSDRLEETGFGVQLLGEISFLRDEESEFRAGGGASDTCTGDSGGPAYLAGTKRLVGITSRSVGTGDCGQGGIYTKVTAFRRFIEHGITTL